MRPSIAFLLIALLTQYCTAQPKIQIGRDEDGNATDASFVNNSGYLKLTPKTLDSIAQLAELKSLQLWGAELSDADFSRFLPLKQLMSIDLSYSKVTREVLATLSKMPALVMINLEGCDVSDEHLVHLSDCKRLITLRLAKTKVTDKGLQHIQNLKSLIHLDLSTCEITDDGLVSLGHLPAIQHLWLSKTVRYGEDDKSNLTDACVDYIASLTTLIDLQIADSRLTDAGLKRLATALPKAKIDTVSSGTLYLGIKKPGKTR